MTRFLAGFAVFGLPTSRTSPLVKESCIASCGCRKRKCYVRGSMNVTERKKWFVRGGCTRCIAAPSWNPNRPFGGILCSQYFTCAFIVLLFFYFVARAWDIHDLCLVVCIVQNRSNNLRSQVSFFSFARLDFAVSHSPYRGGWILVMGKPFASRHNEGMPLSSRGRCSILVREKNILVPF